MPVSKKSYFILMILLICSNNLLAAEGVTVVYPGWFKSSLYDLQGDIQDAREAGKSGIMVFFSTKTCSYCKAIIETTFQQADIVKKLRANYDVIGMEVLSDMEVVDTSGKSLWAKDFAVQEKAKFTPTMIFYDNAGKVLLRLVGYQSPEKFRGVLNYLEGRHYTQGKLGDYLNSANKVSVNTAESKPVTDLSRNKPAKKPLLVVFEYADCSKCRQLRNMLNAPVMQSYTKRLDIVQLDSGDTMSLLTLPDGSHSNSAAWYTQLDLIHRPAMVFFNEQGREILRVDTDILIDPYGKPVPDDDPNILDNVRARLQFVLDKGYITLPQFQRWRAQQARSR